MLCLGLLLAVTSISATPDEPRRTFEQLYQYGKDEYSTKNWPDCVAFMRRAIEDFNYYEDELIWCREHCERRVDKPSIDELSQRYAQAQIALCLMRCRRDRFTEERPALSRMSVYADMMERKPYQYMHISYWHMGELAEAVKSAYTFLVKNPNDKDIIDAINFYMDQPGYEDSMLIDHLQKPYEKHFMEGVAAYMDEDWGKCVDEFERSMSRALEEDKKCRQMCRDKIDWSSDVGFPEIEVLATSMYGSVLRCQHSCLDDLTTVNGHSIGRYLIPAHYQYLHYCQFKLHRVADAAKSVATFFLFDDDPAMRRNKFLYLKQVAKEEYFTPDQEMIDLYKQRVLEKRYLDFVEKRFQYVDNDFPPERVDDRKQLNEEVTVDADTFDYSAISRLLSADECQTLRAPFASSHEELLRTEVEQRIKVIWPTAKFHSRSCSSTGRGVDCIKPFVLSVEKSDCSEWLGAVHAGCSVAFCIA